MMHLGAHLINTKSVLVETEFRQLLAEIWKHCSRSEALIHVKRRGASGATGLQKRFTFIGNFQKTITGYYGKRRRTRTGF